ncbi:ferric-chelate reductase 1-like [Brachionus plicatilis]|uniref:ascorbate ferrireductase (transmembrane) n=1 Tax=Brachionus plicatilis TaxID=10195 RepID=A0A3M7TA79_BRAPC|nr:ferric-chelate reductase 1-like [Brachionus plicatilis]
MADGRQKAHACLMIIAWMIFVPIAIIVARYMRFLFKSRHLCGTSVWLAVHRTLMILVPIFSIAGFLVILANLDWKWVSPSRTLSFIHSVFGIAAIALSLFQVLIAYLRPRYSPSARTVYNIVHRCVGILSLALATIAIFLGVFISDMRLGRAGWSTMIGYVVYLLVIPVPFELIYYFFQIRRAGGTERTNNRWYEILSHIFFNIHVSLILNFGITLIVLIIAGIETFGFTV